MTWDKTRAEALDGWGQHAFTCWGAVGRAQRWREAGFLRQISERQGQERSSGQGRMCRWLWGVGRSPGNEQGWGVTGGCTTLWILPHPLSRFLFSTQNEQIF